jgi:thiamine monophosphate kinase
MDSDSVAQLAAVESLLIAREEFAARIVWDGGDDFYLVAVTDQFGGKGLQASLRAANFGGEVLSQNEEAHDYFLWIERESGWRWAAYETE